MDTAVDTIHTTQKGSKTGPTEPDYMPPVGLKVVRLAWGVYVVYPRQSYLPPTTDRFQSDQNQSVGLNQSDSQADPNPTRYYVQSPEIRVYVCGRYATFMLRHPNGCILRVYTTRKGA